MRTFHVRLIAAFFLMTVLANAGLVPTLPGGSLSGTVGTGFSATFTATGGTPPYTYSISGSIPPGLGAAGNSLSGTPTTAGSYSIFVFVTDASHLVGTGTYTVTINAPPLAISVQGGSTAEVGVAYSASATASGGVPPYQFSASGLPSGLSISSSSGAITGTPSAAGSYSSSVTVKDSRGTTASSSLNLTIAPQLVVSVSLPSSATVGRPYSASFTASGGSPPYQYSAIGLPPGVGISSSSGVVSGTPTAAGTYSLSVTVQDSKGATSFYPVTVTVVPALAISGSLPNGTVGTAYSATLTASGGTAPYTWPAPALPAGLSFSNGTISGTPTAAGTFTISVIVRDAVNLTATATFSVTVSAAPVPPLTITSSLPNAFVLSSYSATLTASGGRAPYTWTASGLPPGLGLSGAVISGTLPLLQTANYTVALTVTDANNTQVSARLNLVVVTPPPLVITPVALSNATVGMPYSASFTTQGVAPLTWTASGLPAGLSFSNGAISGTPTAAGSNTISVHVTDSIGASGDASVPLNVAKGMQTITIVEVPARLMVDNGSFLQANASSGLAVTFSASPASVCSIAGNTVVGYAAGVCTITATQPGNANYLAATATAAFPVYSPVTLTASLSSGTVGMPYSGSLTAANGLMPYSFSLVSGALPAGLSVSSATGAITGTPSAAGSFPLTFQVSDGSGGTATSSGSIVINAAGSPTLSVSSSAVTLNATAGGAPVSQTVTVTYSTPSSGNAPALTASSSAAFLSAPASVGFGAGSTSNGITSYSATLTITANPAALTSSQSGVVTFTANGLTATVNVTFNIALVPISLNPASLAFTFAAGGALPGAQNITATTTPAGFTVSATASTTDGANWLTVSGGSATPATLSVSLGPAAATLSPGAYTGSINLSGVGTGAMTVPVTLTVTAGGAPAISPSGVVPLFSTNPVIQPGNFTSIYGNNLAPSTALWNGDFPTTLNGVSVTIDGKPAYMVSVSPTQVNVQAPDDTTQGPVNVTLTTAAGSTTSKVTLSPVSPSISLLDAKHVAAIAYNADGSYSIIGASGAFPYATRPVAAGEVLVLYGVGFGPTMTPTPAGKALSAATPLAGPIQVTIGGKTAQVAFAGLVAAGLYQINVTVPAGLTPGDQAVVATVGGLTTGNGPVVTIQ